MSRLDVLPPDQRAVLQLVLGQERSYADLAGLLDLDADEVRHRAHAALDALAPEAGRRLSPGRRGAIADWLLGQSAEADAAETTTFLAGSAAGRAWARQAADAVAPLATHPLPEIPADGAASATPGDAGAPDHSAREADRDTVPEDRAAIPRSSKIGGALLLLSIIGLVVVAIITLTGGNDNGSSKADGGPITATTGTTNANAPVPRAQVNLQATAAGGGAKGFATLVTQGNTAGLVIFGQGLPPSGQQLYGIWLVNGGKSLPLGFRPVGRDGRLAAQAPVPTNAAQFRELIITRENVKTGQRTPARPGTVVLRGSLGR